MAEEVFNLLFNIKSQGANTLKQQAGVGQKAMTGLNTATTNVNTSATKANTNLGKTGKSLTEVRNKSQSAAGAIRGFGSGMSTMALGVSALATGIVSLQRSYRDLEDAQGRVDKTQLKLSKANEALVKANEKVKETLDKNGKGSKEYEQALLDQKQAQEQVGIATFNAEEAQEAYNDTQQNFYMSLLPVGIGLMTTATGLFSGFSRNTNAAATATTRLGKASRILNTILRFSPLFLLLGAIIAIKYNIGGFRDKLDQLGKKLGDMFPQLRGFLTWLRNLGDALGLTGGKMDFGKAFDLLKEGFNGAVQTIKTTDWGAVIDNIGTQIQTALTNFDWATAWQGFKDAIWATGVWLAPRLQNIFNSIKKYFEDPAVQEAIWTGFRDALWATGTWLNEQLGKIFNAIYAYFSDPKVQEAIWNGLRTALWMGGTWLLEQLGKIFNAIYSYFADPKVQNAIWNGFRDALHHGGTWILIQLGKVMNTIFTFFSNKKNTDAMWKGFRDALFAAGTWVGLMLGKVLTYIGAWWGANKGKLTSAFVAFWNFIYTSAQTAGGKLVDKMLAGVKGAAGKLKEIGEKIWNGIKGGINSLIDKIPQAVKDWFGIKKLWEGGLIQSAAAGKVFTTRGPTLTMAGDNPGGRETVAYIPHNNPAPTLQSIMKIFGGRQRGFGAGSQAVMGTGTAIIHIYVQVGGRTTEEIVRQVEIGMGRNMRSIIA